MMISEQRSLKDVEDEACRELQFGDAGQVIGGSIFMSIDMHANMIWMSQQTRKPDDS